jgi:hypothetical protein
MSHNQRKPEPRARRAATPRKPSTAQRIANNARNRRPAAPPSIPPAPSNATAAIFHDAVTISWPASPGATGYIIERQNAGNIPWEGIDQIGNLTNYTDNSAASGNSYRYRIIATNAQGNSEPSTPSEWLEL